MLVKKTDFSEWVQFTTNIPNRMLDNHILNAETIEVAPALGDNLYNDIRAISDTNPIAWSNATPYLVGGFAISGNTVYKAIQAGTNHAVTDTNYWEVSSLGTFWLNYIKPWAVFESYRKFLVWQGNNITQFGITAVPTDVGFPVDGPTRAALISDVRNSGNVYKSKAINYLGSIDWTFDTTVYSIDCTDYKKSTPTFGISAGGTKSKINDKR